MANVKYEGTDHAKLLKELDWLNVRELIEYDTASLLCKTENDLAPTDMKNMFMKSNGIFSYHGAYIWNQLPVQIREAQSVKCFQNCLKETIGNR